MRKSVKLFFLTLVTFLLPLAASAAEGAATGGDSNLGPALGAGLAIGLAGLGCGLGQGLTAGIARNPGAAGGMFVNYILGMVLIESIAIYGLLIAFQLVGKIG